MPGVIEALIDAYRGLRQPTADGKLETFIGNQLVDLLTTEQRFTTAWIAGMG